MTVEVSAIIDEIRTRHTRAAFRRDRDQRSGLRLIELQAAGAPSSRELTG